MSGKKRPRTVRREVERTTLKEIRDREKLAALDVGGSAERPIVVESASQIEGHARSMTCFVCGDFYRVIDHVAEHQTRGTSLRIVTAVSPQCGKKRQLYFAIRPALVN